MESKLNAVDKGYGNHMTLLIIIFCLSLCKLSGEYRKYLVIFLNVLGEHFTRICLDQRIFTLLLISVY